MRLRSEDISVGIAKGVALVALVWVAFESLEAAGVEAGSVLLAMAARTGRKSEEFSAIFGEGLNYVHNGEYECDELEKE